jgi:preprotein translocase subunit SecD
MKASLKIGPVVMVCGVLACVQAAVGCHPRGRLTSGTELVVQVQVQDAVVAVADNAMDQIKADLRKNNIRVPEDAITRTEPKTVEEAGTVEIDIKGIPPVQASDFRRIVAGPAYAQWNVNPVNPSGFSMTLHPAAALEIRRNTMDAVTMIVGKRVRALGSTVWIEPAGRDPNGVELLVQFPPVTSPARIVEVIKNNGILQWNEVKEGPFSSRDEAAAKHGGVLPLHSKIVTEGLRGGAGRRFWLVSDIPVVRGSDLVSASASMGEARGWEVDFVLNPAAAHRFEAYTSANIGKQAALLIDGQAVSVPTIQGAIGDRGRITGATTHEEASDLAIALNAPMPVGLVLLEERRITPHPEPGIK